MPHYRTRLLGPQHPRNNGPTRSAVAICPPERERSPHGVQTGLPGLGSLRQHGPERRQRTVGSVPDLSAAPEREAAVADLIQSMYSTKAHSNTVSRIRTITAIFAKFHEVPFPLTADKVLHLGAGLRAGGYRSAANYMSTYKIAAERRGDHIGPQVSRAFVDAARACQRGLGPPLRALALPFFELEGLPGGPSVLSPGRPIGPRNALVLGSWFMMREVELAEKSNPYDGSIFGIATCAVESTDVKD